MLGWARNSRNFSANCFPPASPALRGSESRNAVMAKLTKRVVDAIRPDAAGHDVFVWDAGDGSLKGFGSG